MRKLKLKVDADGNKTSQVHGIRAACKVMKTRYAKPFESVQVEIPYETGMSPYSGLTDFLEAKGVLKKSGNSLEYISPLTGEVIKMFRKPWNANKDGALDLVMSEYNDQEVDKVEEEIEFNDIGENQVNTLNDDQVVVAD
jgi:hypothetical protein